MSIAPESTVVLGNRFATELPELAVRWQAESTPEPRLLVLNEPLAAELGLDARVAAQPRRVGCAGRQRGCPRAPSRSPRAMPATSSAAGCPASATVAHCCSANSSTPTGRLRDLHLKGSGRTPFARGGDGLAAVGPMLREYVVSEAMHALGIPTTRSLSVVATGRQCNARPCSTEPSWRASQRVTCAWAASNTSRLQANSMSCGASPTTRSPGTTPQPPRPTIRTSRYSTRSSPLRPSWWPDGCWSGSSTG